MKLADAYHFILEGKFTDFFEFILNIDEIERPEGDLWKARLILEFQGKKGLGFPKGITGLKGKRGKLRTRPLADRSVCLKPNPGIKARHQQTVFAICKIYANPANFVIYKYS